MNLLKETLNDIKLSGHTPNDIIFIGSEVSGYSCTWDEFNILADHEYDAGFGAQQVADDIIIVFSDGMKMTRHEYDGSECWTYSTPFVMPTNIKHINHLFCRNIGWDDLSTINQKGEPK